MSGLGPGAEEEDVARFDGDPLAILGGVEIGGGDRSVALQAVDASGASDVEQDAASDQVRDDGIDRVARYPVPGGSA